MSKILDSITSAVRKQNNLKKFGSPLDSRYYSLHILRMSSLKRIVCSHETYLSAEINTKEDVLSTINAKGGTKQVVCVCVCLCEIKCNIAILICT